MFYYTYDTSVGFVTIYANDSAITQIEVGNHHIEGNEQKETQLIQTAYK